MKWLNMKQCLVEGCKNAHEARGYCKRHYKSFMKYGDASQVDKNKKERAEKKILVSNGLDLTVRGNVRVNVSTEGLCSVESCNKPVKAKKLCDMHYTRVRRNGVTNPLRPINELYLEDCLVIGCDRRHYRGGYCNTHYGYNLKHRTPYLAKTVKLCGIDGCENVHVAKGLCGNHYNQWMTIMKKHSIDWRKENEETNKDTSQVINQKGL